VPEARRPKAHWALLPVIEQHLQVATLIEAMLDPLARHLRLTLTEARVLACIGRLTYERDGAPPLPSEISEETGYSRPRVSEAVAALKDKELVRKRSPATEDRRTSPLVLTLRGIGRLEQLNLQLSFLEFRVRDRMRVHPPAVRSWNLERVAHDLRELVEPIKARLEAERSLARRKPRPHPGLGDAPRR
jgi:DNA-binding MarR family transcriptional regulator